MSWLIEGFMNATWWQIVIFTLVVTHVTMISVTVYLHRHQTHRALELHKVSSQFFRCWLWLTTGIVTKEWVSIHRKHHAKCETDDDPHSPKTRGIRTVLLEGSELYRSEAKNPETLQKYGKNTPDDWIEKNVYARFSRVGVVLMLGVDIALFGVIGITVWAIQMVWSPIMAAGVINGIGHYWGYRNFDIPNSSTNILPWGILIAGEELHNNHHRYPASAKLSMKSYEFDIGWMYIQILSFFGLAKVRKIVPQPTSRKHYTEVSSATLRALIDNRLDVMAIYGREIKKVCVQEMYRFGINSNERQILSVVKQWIHVNPTQIPDDIKHQLDMLGNPTVVKLMVMRDQLQKLWLDRTQRSQDEQLDDLRNWFREAQASNIEALQLIVTRLQSMASLQK